MRKPVAIDLSFWCGGLTLGLKQAGFRVLGAVEIDPLAVETYQGNHEGVAVWPQDISKVAPRVVKRKVRPRKDELCLFADCPLCGGQSSLAQ